jgi:hypothetical protein
MSIHHTPRALLAAAVLVLPVVGCGDGQDAGSGAAEPAATDLPTGGETVTLDPDEFTPDSDNPWFPLVPRTRWTYAEHDADGTTLQVVVTVTDQTREIANGVEARVVRDTVLEDGEVIEDTFDWFAQDAEGNVWYLGEDTAEFEDGELATREGSFEAGVDGAQPGVIMPADPRPGQSYRQEYLEGEAEDQGAILATGQQAETPAGHWDDVLLTADTIPLEPDVLEYKLYARDVGLVLTLDVSGGAGREELTSTTQVSPAQAAAAGTTPLGEPYLP